MGKFILRDRIRGPERWSFVRFAREQLRLHSLPCDLVMLVTFSRRLVRQEAVIKRYRPTRSNKATMMGMRVALSARVAFPTIIRVPVERVTVKNATDRALMGCDRFDETVEVRFDGAHEFAAFHVGRALLRILRNFQLTGEPASPWAMNRQGLKWLEGYRAWLDLQRRAEVRNPALDSGCTQTPSENLAFVSSTGRSTSMFSVPYQQPNGFGEGTGIERRRSASR